MHLSTPTLLRQTALQYAEKQAKILQPDEEENERLTYLGHKTKMSPKTQKYRVSDY